MGIHASRAEPPTTPTRAQKRPQAEPLTEEKAQREQPEREERRRRLRVKTRVIDEGEPLTEEKAEREVQEHQEEHATRVIDEGEPLTDEKAEREVQEHEEGHALTFRECMFDILSYVPPPLLQDTESMQEDLEQALVSPVLRDQVCLLLGQEGCDHVYDRAHSLVQDDRLMTYVRCRCDVEGHAATVLVLAALLIEASDRPLRSVDEFKWVACTASLHAWIFCDIADRGALKNLCASLSRGMQA